LVNKICLDNSILSNSESCDGYPFNLQQFRDLILARRLLWTIFTVYTCSPKETKMKVSDILRLKSNTLFSVTPNERLAIAVQVMAEKDIGSLVVMAHGDLVGMLTFREVIQSMVNNGGSVGTMLVRTAMDDAPLTCTIETELDEVRRMMLDRHARYMPVMDNKLLMGVISFYDVAKAVVDSQNFENKMLKAYIRDWPQGDDGSK
jgi:CBS domain-containing protein